ncbi:MAG: AraC family transcriptional regulator [Victivallales bacterium]
MDNARLLKAETTLDPVSGVNYKINSIFSVSSGSHTHDFMEVFLISKGSIRHLINGKEQRLIEGDLVFIRAEDTHSFRQYRDSECELINLAFNVSLFKEINIFFQPEFSLESALKEYLPVIKSLGSTEKKYLYERMTEGGERLLQNPAEAGVYFKILTAEVLSMFKKRKTGDVHAGNLPVWMERILTEMKKKDNFKKGLLALRKLACRSDEHTSRSFRLYQNTTPTDFINELRIKYAASCLLNSDEKIDFIAIDAGFDNLSHFYHTFKKIYGSSPRKYRLLNRKNTVIV